MIHLHVHSEYSILDGCGSQKRFGEKAKSLGHTAIAFTEHGSMRGVRNQNETLSEIGIKPIFGFEAYLANDRFTKELPPDVSEQIKASFPRSQQREATYQAEIKLGIRPRYHLTLLAENDEGLSNLFQLSSRGWIDGFAFKRPRLDFGILEDYSEGVVCLSGCPIGPVARELREGRARTALRHLERLRAIYGDSRLYLEIMPHVSLGEDLAKANQGLVKIARRYDLPLVATQDAHYTEPGDSAAHEALLAITTHGNLISPKRFRFTGSEYWMKSEEEMREGFEAQGLDGNAIDEAIASTDEIGERCNATFKVDKFAALLPAVEIEPGLLDGFDKWRRERHGKGAAE